MSEENVELVRRVFDAYNQRDLDLMLSYGTEDLTLDVSESRSPNQGVYRGEAEVRAVWKTFVDAWDQLHWEPLELQALDADRVLSANRLTARGRGSGIEMTAHGAMIWTIRDGKVSQIRMFQSKAEALEATGLEE